MQPRQAYTFFKKAILHTKINNVTQHIVSKAAQTPKTITQD